MWQKSCGIETPAQVMKLLLRSREKENQSPEQNSSGTVISAYTDSENTLKIYFKYIIKGSPFNFKNTRHSINDSQFMKATTLKCYKSFTTPRYQAVGPNMHRNKYTLIQEAPSSFTDKMHAVQGIDKLRSHHHDSEECLLKPILFTTLQTKLFVAFITRVNTFIFQLDQVVFFFKLELLLWLKVSFACSLIRIKTFFQEFNQQL